MRYQDLLDINRKRYQQTLKYHFWARFKLFLTFLTIFAQVLAQPCLWRQKGLKILLVEKVFLINTNLKRYRLATEDVFWPWPRYSFFTIFDHIWAVFGNPHGDVKKVSKILVEKVVLIKTNLNRYQSGSEKMDFKCAINLFDIF